MNSIKEKILNFFNNNQKLILTGGILSGVSLYFLKKYSSGGQCPKELLDPKKNKDLKNQLVIVTGANSGIGFESTKAFYKLGANVIMGCRNVKLGEEAKLKIENSTKGGKLTVLELNLENFESIENFSEKVLEMKKGIKILLLNAGTMMNDHGKTQSGYEIQFGTNHLAHFYLTGLLFSNFTKFEEIGQKRVVVLSSLAHYGTKNIKDSKTIDFSILKTDGRNYTVSDLYAQSKLSNLLFSRKLDKIFKEKNINAISCSLHPGVVRTNLVRHILKNFEKKISFSLFSMKFSLLPLTNLIFFIPFYLFLKSPKDGAQTSLFCSLSNNVEGSAYYSDCKKTKPSKYVSEEIEEKLWEWSKNQFQKNIF